MSNINEWKKSNRTLEILRKAQEGKYGVIAIIAYTFDQAVTMVRTAEKMKSPIMILVFPWAITSKSSGSNGELVRAISELSYRAKVPVSVHLDHAQDIELIKYCAQYLPFDSIMVDMSHYSREDNLKHTRELVEYCNQYKIATEAEPGRIEGGEDGILHTGDLEGLLTNIEEAKLFFDTGIDIIAPSFGNVHGDYGKEGPSLNFDIVKDIFKLIETDYKTDQENISYERYVCLHGTNEFSKELMQENIKHGITKLNINKLILQIYFHEMQSYYQGESGTKVGFTEAIDKSNEKLSECLEYWMNACGSSNTVL
ncbi:catalytic activity protein [[Candida] boidinii]|nr:catalytic activity protein [[Candida] boidinii]OWB59478.1 catalytic activity protein [[Candida] boidinii]GMF04717.1 unnamed protein product [[Candida] boidinii]